MCIIDGYIGWVYWMSIFYGGDSMGGSMGNRLYLMGTLDVF